MPNRVLTVRVPNPNHRTVHTAYQEEESQQDDEHVDDAQNHVLGRSTPATFLEQIEPCEAWQVETEAGYTECRDDTQQIGEEWLHTHIIETLFNTPPIQTFGREKKREK